MQIIIIYNTTYYIAIRFGFLVITGITTQRWMERHGGTMMIKVMARKSLRDTFPSKRFSRTFWKKLHLWLALAAALPLLVTAATGTVLAYQPWLERWLEPVHFAAHDNGQEPLDAATAVRTLQAYAPEIQLNYVSVPEGETQRPYVVYASIGDTDSDSGRENFVLFLNPYTGDITRRSEPGLIKFIERLHRNLALGKPGRYWVGFSSLALMILSFVGLYLWWPMRKSTLRRARRVNDLLSWHNLSGLVSFPLMLLIAFTGITLTFNAQIMPLVRLATFSPAVPDAPSIAPLTAPALTLDKVVELVKSRYSPATITAFSGRGRADSAFHFWLRDADDMHPKGWQRVFIHPQTGATLAHVDTYQHSWASAYERSWFTWHTGAMLGTPGRVLWSVVSATVLITGVSGIVFWRRRRQAKRAQWITRALVR